MAVLGIQLVFTMIMATIFHKIFPYYSPARRLITGLKRYVHPSMEELLRYRPSKRSGNKKKNQESPLSLFDLNFTIPKDNDIELEEKQIRDDDLDTAHFCDDYELLMNLFICSVGVHLLTQGYYSFALSKTDREEANLAVIWLICAMLHSVYVIFVMNTAVFWGSEGTGERSLMIVCGSFFFVAAMGLMLLDDNVLDLGLNSAYSNISQKTGKFMESRGMTPWTLNGIGIVWKLSVGLGCAFLSAFLTFPGLRYAKGHLDVLSDHQHSSIISLLVNLSFFLPLFISLLWIQSLTKEPLVTNKILTDDCFGAVRLGSVMLFCVLRLLMFRTYIQSHLKLAYKEFHAMKREPGRIPVLSFQRNVRAVFQYLFGCGLQYLAPIIFLFCWAMLAQGAGRYSIFALSEQKRSSSLGPVYTWGAHASDEATRNVGLVGSAVASILNTPAFWENLLLFGCWWHLTTSFLVSSFGVIYYRYIAKEW